MMRTRLLLAAAAAAILSAAPSMADDRYGERPPLVVSPDLSAPWVLQLRQGAVDRTARRDAEKRQHAEPRGAAIRRPSISVQPRGSFLYRGVHNLHTRRSYGRARCSLFAPTSPAWSGTAAGAPQAHVARLPRRDECCCCQPAAKRPGGGHTQHNTSARELFAHGTPSEVVDCTRIHRLAG